ncbi:MAG: M48 family metallopeptidase [Candidatus Andersenbacteria bacterium]
MATLYEQISTNKIRSFILMVVVLVVVIGLVGLYSYAVRGDLSLPILAAIIAIPSALIGYFAGDKIALASNGAKPLPDEAAPDLHNVIENLAITAGIPKPKLYLIDSPALNAFATGRDPKHASIAVTRGLVERLERSELEGVLAHELAHVKNYDIRFGTLVAIFVGFVVILADLFMRASLWGGLRTRGDREHGQAGGILALVGLVLLIVSPIIVKLIQLAVSRQREYLADASGALLTRYPEGLASALEKISASPPLETAGNATAHLYIANPFRARTIAHLFATHPPIEERIRRLRESV